MVVGVTCSMCRHCLFGWLFFYLGLCGLWVLWWVVLVACLLGVVVACNVCWLFGLHVIWVVCLAFGVAWYLCLCCLVCYVYCGLLILMLVVVSIGCLWFMVS